METDEGAQQSVRAARVRDASVWLLAVSMALAAATLIPLPRGLPTEVPGPTWWVLLSVFAATEVLVIHLPTVRNAHSHTLREVPAVAGLAFLSPAPYVVAYILGSGLALLVVRRQRGIKLVFNLSLFALEAALGLMVYRFVLGPAAPQDPRGWAAAFAAVLTTDLVSTLAITTAISLKENRFDHAVLRESLRDGIPAAMVNTCLALVVVVLAVTSPAALPLLGAVFVMLFAAYRGYVSLATGYSRLQLLYRFVGSAGQSADLTDEVALLLREARQLMRADRSELIVLPIGDDPGSRTALNATGIVVREPWAGPLPGRDAWWAPAALGEPVLRARGDGSRAPAAREAAADLLLRDGIAAPLCTDGRVEAVFVVADRTFEAETFGEEDLRLFETLAAHAAVSLGKARLVDRLRRLATQREHEALHDHLTDLPNRRGFREAVASVTSSGRCAAVLLLDLDDFKDVNDTLGHPAGDALLRELGDRLRLAVDGVVARLGGDEFAILLPGVTLAQASDRARGVLTALAAPVVLPEVTLLVSASIGVALLPDHGTDTDELLQHADVAMYAAKAAGSGVAVYKAGDAHAIHRRLVLAADLTRAIDEHQFEVWYQPQANSRTGQVVAAEALLRWSHPAFGPVPPPEIVSLAERTGLLRRLTDAILRSALDQRASWHAEGHRLSISVNITPTDLADESFPAIVADLLTSTCTPPAALTLEITESGVMTDPEKCLDALNRLAHIGVRLAIDDFGTGYSSLAYLEQLPIHEVKIDKTFVHRLEREASDSKVIRATIALAHDLGLAVVAEGIESDEAWSRLVAMNCEQIQGYALARPMPYDELSAWLTAHQGSRAGRALPLQPLREARGAVAG